MRVAIQTLGTRGDVQPYVALALRLQARGHEVQLAAPLQFEALVRDRNIPFAPLPGEFLALLEDPEAKAAISGRGFGAGFKLLRKVKPLMCQLFDAEWEALRTFSPDILVYHPKSVMAPSMADALRIPHVLASPLPGFTPTSEFPSPLLPFRSLGPFNRLSHMLAMRSPRFLFGSTMRRWRSAALGLDGRLNVSPPSGMLYAYSPHVVPIPGDWREDVLVSGYWFLDQREWNMPDDWQDFLRAGDKPVYIGFGSMPGVNPEALAEIAVAALSSTGRRGILATGGGALKVGKVPSNIHVIASAPHDQLFNHVSAAVHHGGAGTTAAAIRVGIPSTTCPFFGDQPFWARRVVELGIGPMPLNIKTLTASDLSRALAAMEDGKMRANAESLGAKVIAEDGAGAAATFLEAIQDARRC